MFTFEIKKDGALCGTISFDDKGKYQKKISDKTLADIVAGIEKTGVPIRHCVPEKGGLLMVEKTVSKSDPLFPRGLIHVLQEAGYGAQELHPELDREILTLIEQKIKGGVAREKLQKTLPDMNYLEKTLVLEALKNEK